MKRFNLLLTAAALLFLTQSCQQNSFKKTETGLNYRIIDDQDGEKIRLGDIVQLHLAYYTDKDSLLYDSRAIGDSFILKIQTPTFVGGIEEGLQLLSKGDSAEFLLPGDSIFRKTFQQPMPAFLAKGSLLKFRVRIKSILSEQEFLEKQKKDYAKQQREQLQIIEKYLIENSIQAQPVSQGIYFILFKEGNGKVPVMGDSVQVQYTGKTLKGRVFDSSGKGGKYLQYRIGNGNYLEAWERAITSMKEGSLARLVLTSDNAFGKSTSAPVPPDTPVVFDIELIKVY